MGRGVIQDWSGGGGTSEVLPLKKRGGGKGYIAMLKRGGGGRKKCFGVVFTQELKVFRHSDWGGGCKRFPTFEKGGGCKQIYPVLRWRGSKVLDPRFSHLLPPSS